MGLKVGELVGIAVGIAVGVLVGIGVGTGVGKASDSHRELQPQEPEAQYEYQQLLLQLHTTEEPLNICSTPLFVTCSEVMLFPVSDQKSVPLVVFAVRLPLSMHRLTDPGAYPTAQLYGTPDTE